MAKVAGNHRRRLTVAGKTCEGAKLVSAQRLDVAGNRGDCRCRGWEQRRLLLPGSSSEDWTAGARALAGLLSGW